MYKFKQLLGDTAFTLLTLPIKLLIGWPLYLLIGASGSPLRGKTNHFLPNKGSQGQHALFPGRWKSKVCKRHYVYTIQL